VALITINKRFIIHQIKMNSEGYRTQKSHISINTVQNLCRKNGYHGRVARKKF